MSFNSQSGLFLQQKLPHCSSINPLYANAPVFLKSSPGLVDYNEAVAFMENHVGEMIANKAPEHLWFLEHPPLYSAGSSACPQDLLQADRFPVFVSGRGGQYTYHGPGQLVVYVMLDLNHRGRDIRAFVNALEDWLITTLHDFGITGERREGRVGVWVSKKNGEEKIAALGIRVRRWISFHGISLNIAPDLSHFSGIVPCGIAQYGITSFKELGLNIDRNSVETALKINFQKIFGPLSS